MRLPKIIIIGVITLSALATSSCGATNITENGNNEKIVSGVVEFPNGAAYTCVRLDGFYISDLKCDWASEVTTYAETIPGIYGSVERVGNRNVECAVTKQGKSGGLDCNM